MNDDIEWATPPEPSHASRRSKYKPFVDALRAHPGEWAVFKRNGSPSYSTSIKQGVMKEFRPPAHFEVRTVRATPGSGLVDIYVRFIGEREVDA